MRDGTVCIGAVSVTFNDFAEACVGLFVVLAEVGGSYFFVVGFRNGVLDIPGVDPAVADFGQVRVVVVVGPRVARALEITIRI